MCDSGELCSLLLDIPPQKPIQSLDFLSKSKVLRFLEKNSHWSNGTCDSGEFLSPAGQIDPRIVPKS